MLESCGIENQNRLQCRPRTAQRGIEDWDSEALTPQHEPDDAQLPVREPVDLRVRTAVEIEQWPRSDELLAGRGRDGKPERDIRDLLSQGVDSSVHPDNLLIGIRQ